MLARLRVLVVGLWLGCLAGFSAHAATTLVIVSSERSAAYLEAAETLLGELERGGLARNEVLLLTVKEWSALAPLNPKLFVALGMEAASALAKAETRVPVLCTLLPRSSFERVLRTSGRKSSAQFSALYLSQPLKRQLELIRLALPTARRIAVLWGPESQAQAPKLRALVQAAGMELVEASVGPDELVFPSLRSILEGTDLLLAVADPQVYNGNSIQNILLTTFRAKVPMQAFSPAYVRAGALLALHATPNQIGLQAATLARAALQGKMLPATPVYSLDFQVTVNQHVARSLGLTLDGDDLRQQLRRAEGAP